MVTHVALSDNSEICLVREHVLSARCWQARSGPTTRVWLGGGGPSQACARASPRRWKIVEEDQQAGFPTSIRCPCSVGPPLGHGSRSFPAVRRRDRWSVRRKLGQSGGLGRVGGMWSRGGARDRIWASWRAAPTGHPLVWTRKWRDGLGRRCWDAVERERVGRPGVREREEP